MGFGAGMAYAECEFDFQHPDLLHGKFVKVRVDNSTLVYLTDFPTLQDPLPAAATAASTSSSAPAQQQQQTA